MENMEINYRVATPEEKESVMKKLTPRARERVEEIYRVLPTIDDLKKMDTGDVVCLRVVHRSEVNEALKAEGYEGSDAEVSALLKYGLEARLNEEKDEARRIITEVIRKAGSDGEISFADERRKVLKKNGCAELACSLCSLCENGFCDHYGGSVSDVDALDCIHFENDEQSRLFLKEKGMEGKSIALPFMLAEPVTPDVQEIIRVADEYCVAESVRVFLENAKKRGREVAIVTESDECIDVL